ncbi:receptor-like protein EIX2 [Aristolochia californica]|uniref:receptor-like protein EIX2 n=1 Tax=Aristolochia californica TaxID=171875 RepID=UPI0035E0CE35
MGNSPVERPVLGIVSLSLIYSWVVLCVGGQCHDGERRALIKFRSGLNDPLNRLSSWGNHSNCCRWSGIACDKKTGYVTKLDFRNPYPNWLETGEVSGHGYWNLGGRLDLSLLELKHLRYVDLSLNSFEGNSIPAFLGSLRELKYLNLSNAGFQGNIPPQLWNLSKLEYLDVSSLRFGLAINSLKMLGNVHNLRYLDMTFVDLERAGEHWLHMINQLPLLQEFRCEYCGLTNLPPTLSFINFTSIAVLDLSGNSFKSTIPNWMANLSHLVSLDLSNNMFHATIPDWLPQLHFLQEINLASAGLIGSCTQTLEGNWESIVRVDLSGNQLYGEIPMSIGNITSLVELDLSHNRINGSIPESISNLHQLELLDLSNNNIDGGPTLDKLCQLKKLKGFSLPRCNLTGTIPACLGKISSLEVINLQSNQLDGALPDSLGQLAQLSELQIGNNSLSGTVSEVHFKYLSNLSVLDMSSNFLTLHFKDDWSPPFNLSKIRLGSCHLGPQFPAWLKTQKQLYELDISNANISGNVPEWFWDIRPISLNISRNMIEGKLPNSLKVGQDATQAATVDLSYNLFWGPVPSVLGSVFIVDISNNKFSGPLPQQIAQAFPGLGFFYASNNQISGTIPMSIGEIELLFILDLSKNNLRGSIPPTIGNCGQLLVLDLSENFLQGDIPETIGSLYSLKYLHMEKNNLSGQIPYSIYYCFNLETIDLGENRLFGNIPATIGNLSHLRKLRLRSNLLSGKIPPQLARAQSMHVLDLAHNNLTGLIPPGLSKIFAKKNQFDVSKLWFGFSPDILIDMSHYMDNLFVLRKGHMQEYTRTLFLVTSLDLSNNNLEGKIPEELTNISNLLLLNLAHNHFSGNIPKNIGNLSFLESLDLSSNQLFGSIPQSLSFLTSLSYLNLSYNNLSGRIPSGPQLQVLDYPSIYWGNPELCGPPVTDMCPGDNRTRVGEGIGDEGQENENDGNEESDILWFYSGIAPGFAVGFSGVLLILMFKESWRLSFFQFADTLSTKLSLHARYWVVLCVGGQCHDGERGALTKFRNGLNDPLNRLSSWGNHSDCCRWRGIACDKKTGSWLLEFERWTGSKFTGTETSKPSVDLSFNLFWGPVPSMLGGVYFVDISNNKLSGPLPQHLSQALPCLQFFFASNNQISGTIPMSIGEMKNLSLIDLSKNNLRGSIPPTIGNCRYLLVLNLSENFLEGDIPESIGSLNFVRYLHMEKNNLSGQIPYSIYNCSYLETVDLGENRLFGNIPAMIGTFSRLRKLRLRSNLLSGKIPPQLAQTQFLHVLDLAYNNLTGLIPPSFGKLFAMRNRYEYDVVQSYVDNLFVLRKGQMQEYKSTLSLVTSLDLSNNNLEGQIPEELTKSSDLLLLNLAHNRFTGNIPKNIGNLSLLESLDFSSNQLSGSIPQSLSFITSLSYLNLSYNNLFGRIPSGPQLQVLDYPSIYWGNPELCGPPLIDMCPGDNHTRAGEGIGDEGQENENDGNEETDMLWVYSGIAPGFAVGFSGVLLILMFKESWRLSFFQFADTLSTKLSLHAR